MTSDYIGAEAAAAKISDLLNRPGTRERVSAIRASMTEADTIHAHGLAAIRRAASLTQVELATQMGVAQSEISRIESRSDMLLSTLTSYLNAAGEHPRVTVTVHGQDIELDLSTLNTTPNGFGPVL